MKPAAASARRSAVKPLSLKARAIALLAQREHSAAELRRKLLRIARDQARDRARAQEQGRAAAAEAVAGGSGRAGFLATEAEVEASADTDQDPDEAGAGQALALAAEVEQLLTWLQSQGYLNEERFIESRVHLRSQRFGGLRIKQELAQHGLTLSPEQAQTLRDGELDRAREVRRRKFGDDAPVEQADRAKQSRFLAARGFSPETIRRALKPED